jgi:hypothetical protein
VTIAERFNVFDWLLLALGLALLCLSIAHFIGELVE